MTNKMRLILWPTCNRDCPGCCNKSFDYEALPRPEDFTGYKDIILTGGEPLLYPDMVRELVRGIRSVCDPDTRLILYTAHYTINAVSRVLWLLDGMTITLHEQDDVKQFMRLYEWLVLTEGAQGKTMRLNVFEGIDVPDVSDIFTIKRDIVWIENCPLPEGEVLMRWA